MDEAGHASMGRWTQSHITRTDLRGGGMMDDVRIFLAQWTMLGTSPWDDGQYPHIAQADLRCGGTMDDVRIFLPQWTMLDVRPWDDG